MKDRQFHIYLDDEEYGQVLQALIDLKNNLIAQRKRLPSSTSKENRNYAACFSTEKRAAFCRFRSNFQGQKNFFQIFFGKGVILGVHFAPLCPNE